jgi:hypothetical protein
VVIRVVSRPASGSVTPKQVIRSPAMIDGNQAAFCSGVPCFTMACGPKMFRCTALAADMAPGELATASIITTACATPSPEPPYSSGMATPSQPPAATAWRNSWGKDAVSSRSSQ